MNEQYMKNRQEQTDLRIANAILWNRAKIKMPEVTSGDQTCLLSTSINSGRFLTALVPPKVHKTIPHAPFSEDIPRVGQVRLQFLA